MKNNSLTFAIVVLLIAVISVPGCNKTNSRKIPKNFDYGTWTGTTYRNDFFGFSITVPEGWHVTGSEDMKAVIQEGQNLIEDALDKSEVEKMAKIADITTANLFMVARYSDEQAMEQEASNPNIVLIVENLGTLGKQIDLAKYVSLYRQNLTKAAPGIVFKSETTKTIGGQEFTSLQLQFSTQGILISQEHLICLKNGFSVTFALTTLDDSEKQPLDDIMATLKWD